jgi:hypothetical protein
MTCPLWSRGHNESRAVGYASTPDGIKELRAQNLPFRCHACELAYANLDIEHRLTKPRHPWTNV